MRLLVTNTREAQTYAIIRSLRPHADRIITTMYGENKLAAFTSHAAHSRMVDGRYYVPVPEADWQSGKIQKENTPKEEKYLKAVLDICHKEKIDAIFPSHDPQVYILSKNKERFKEIGVTIPVPDYDTLIKALDKHVTMTLAEKAGFPIPRTFMPKNEDDITAIADEIEPPWVIKPRLSTRSRGMEIVNTREALFKETRRISKDYENPMIQEYIPGGQKQNFYILTDRQGKVKSIFCPKIIRHSQRLYRNSSAACIFSDNHPMIPQITEFVEMLNWRGALTLQTKIDARDGIPKMMEINPRLGSHLWYRTEMGINEPLFCLQIAKGEDIPEINGYKLGTLLLEPIEDAFGFVSAFVDIILYRYRTVIRRKPPTDPLNAPPSYRELFRSYQTNYFGNHNRKFSPHFTYFFNDVFSNLLWSYASFRYTLNGMKKIGK